MLHSLAFFFKTGINFVLFGFFDFKKADYVRNFIFFAALFFCLELEKLKHTQEIKTDKFSEIWLKKINLKGMGWVFVRKPWF